LAIRAGQALNGRCTIGILYGLVIDIPMNQLICAPSGSDGLQQEDLFPIREVARLTGVNPVTLRAWERRYGLIVPTRTEGGHRLYSQADVDTVRSITGWIERGVAVSKVGQILARARDQDAKARGPRSLASSDGQQAWQAHLRQAVNEFNEHRLQQICDEIFSSCDLTEVFEDVLMPVWRDFAARRDAFGQISEWLFLDSFLRVRTLERARQMRRDTRQHVLLAALPGACRELELWVAGLLLSTEQTRLSVLAPGQPLEELSLLCGKMQPDALVLFSNDVPIADLPKRLLRLGLGLNCPLLLAGETADLAQDSLQGSPIACLGAQGHVMQRRLEQFLAGRLDT